MIVHAAYEGPPYTGTPMQPTCACQPQLAGASPTSGKIIIGAAVVATIIAIFSFMRAR